MNRMGVRNDANMTSRVIMYEASRRAILIDSLTSRSRVSLSLAASVFSETDCFFTYVFRRVAFYVFLTRTKFKSVLRRKKQKLDETLKID